MNKRYYGKMAISSKEYNIGRLYVPVSFFEKEYKSCKIKNEGIFENQYIIELFEKAIKFRGSYNAVSRDGSGYRIAVSSTIVKQGIYIELELIEANKVKMTVFRNQEELEGRIKTNEC